MPKNVMCKNCNNFKLKHEWCEKVIDSPDPDIRRDCQHFWERTNADRIRAMSDEELAVWITSIRLDTINEMCKKFDVEIEMPVPTVENTADVCEWLKKPAEGENNVG